MKKITVSNKYFSVECVVDEKIFHKYELSKYTWYALYSANSMKIHTYVINNGRTKMLFLHRLITDCPENMVVDHINGDGLDNRLSNLRICSKYQNNLNIGRNSNKKYKSKYLGVTYCPHNPSKPWKAVASVNNKSKNLGYFSSEEEAAIFRDNFVFKVRGEYARLNFNKE